MIKTKTKVMRKSPGRQLMERFGVAWKALSEAGVTEQFVQAVDALLDEREARCMADICSECREGMPVRYDSGFSFWNHHDDHGNEIGCRASSIRNRSRTEGKGQS